LDAIGRDVERSEDSDTADPEMGDPAAGDPANHAAVRADGLVRFFTLVFRPGVSSVKVLGTHLGVQSSTLASRFYRAGLPSPKRYLTWARLAWAAGLGESPGLSIRAIADRLDASSPQSFHRTVRQCTGYTAAEFCRMATGARMLDHYLTTLVAPYRDVLRDFDPLGSASTTTRRLPKGVQAAAGRVA
jgi:AraC-like DNA-binding protein